MLFFFKKKMLSYLVYIHIIGKFQIGEANFVTCGISFI
jgi:hypothetical protein